jgi:non-specific serine/threonine protein kinase
MKRRGLVLSSIMKLKQICNHPDQFTDGESYAEKESGKFEYLRELCQTIYEKRERVLVFTQFKEICPALDKFLESIFGTRGFVLHGGTSVAKRNKMVEEFQSDEYIPYMVISVKAGGVGLNLTNANHVIHFDRWWNPAVENQATDRAFRIGQTKNVMVHKFVCTGTIEEKIDELIKSKIELAQNVIGADSGENWITEMTNEELLKMFRLEA